MDREVFVKFLKAYLAKNRIITLRQKIGDSYIEHKYRLVGIDVEDCYGSFFRVRISYEVISLHQNPYNLEPYITKKIKNYFSTDEHGTNLEIHIHNIH